MTINLNVVYVRNQKERQMEPEDNNTPNKKVLRVPAIKPVKKSVDNFKVPKYLEGTSNVTELNIRLWAASGILQRVK